MIQDKPVFGFGILQGGKAYLAHYRTKADTQGLHHFHNIYVQTAVDSGLVGLMGLASWILSSFYLFRHVENSLCVCRILCLDRILHSGDV